MTTDTIDIKAKIEEILQRKEIQITSIAELGDMAIDHPEHMKEVFQALETIALTYPETLFSIHAVDSIQQASLFSSGLTRKLAIESFARIKSDRAVSYIVDFADMHPHRALAALESIPSEASTQGLLKLASNDIEAGLSSLFNMKVQLNDAALNTYIEEQVYDFAENTFTPLNTLELVQNRGDEGIESLRGILQRAALAVPKLQGIETVLDAALEAEKAMDVVAQKHADIFPR